MGPWMYQLLENVSLTCPSHSSPALVILGMKESLFKGRARKPQSLDKNTSNEMLTPHIDHTQEA